MYNDVVVARNTTAPRYSSQRAGTSQSVMTQILFADE